MNELPEPDLDALREDIRRAGRTVGRLRIGLACVLLISLLCWTGYQILFAQQLEDQAADAWSRAHPYSIVERFPEVRVIVGVLAACAGVPSALLVTVTIAVAWRALSLLWLRRRLAATTQQDCIRMLVSLEDDECGDTRDLAARLRRLHARSSTEPSPSAAPAGRGDEVTAGEEG